MVSFLALVVIAALTCAVRGQAPWSYNDYAHDGPNNWGNLDPSYRMCSAGRNQSPISLSSTNKVLSSRMVPSYHWISMDDIPFSHNGHAIEADLARFKNYVSLKQGSTKQRYRLAQFHVHTPSEHLERNAPYDFEVHFVAKPEGQVAYGFPQAIVSAVWFSTQQAKQSNYGQETMFIHNLIRNLPFRNGPPVSIQHLSLDRLLKRANDFVNAYSYDGSLTTPPCTEGVKWFIARNKIWISQQAANALRNSIGFNNARHAQNNNNAQAFGLQQGGFGGQNYSPMQQGFQQQQSQQQQQFYGGNQMSFQQQQQPNYGNQGFQNVNRPGYPY